MGSIVEYQGIAIALEERRGRREGRGRGVCLYIEGGGEFIPFVGFCRTGGFKVCFKKKAIIYL